MTWLELGLAQGSNGEILFSPCALLLRYRRSPNIKDEFLVRQAFLLGLLAGHSPKLGEKVSVLSYFPTLGWDTFPTTQLGEAIGKVEAPESLLEIDEDLGG
jgi:hypothetical protein